MLKWKVIWTIHNDWGTWTEYSGCCYFYWHWWGYTDERHSDSCISKILMVFSCVHWQWRRPHWGQNVISHRSTTVRWILIKFGADAGQIVWHKRANFYSDRLSTSRVIQNQSSFIKKTPCSTGAGGLWWLRLEQLIGTVRERRLGTLALQPLQLADRRFFLRQQPLILVPQVVHTPANCLGVAPPISKITCQSARKNLSARASAVPSSCSFFRKPRRGSARTTSNTYLPISEVFVISRWK